MDDPVGIDGLDPKMWATWRARLALNDFQLSQTLGAVEPRQA